MVAEAELLDVVLTERRPPGRSAPRSGRALPEGWTSVDLADVWLGGPPLAGRVAAADYRVALGGPASRGPGGGVRPRLLAARASARTRQGGRHVRYDLRPLLVDIGVVDGEPRVTVGSGPGSTRSSARAGRRRSSPRSATRLGVPLAIEGIVRERLVLADELDG